MLEAATQYVLRKGNVYSLVNAKNVRRGKITTEQGTFDQYSGLSDRGDDAELLEVSDRTLSLVDRSKYLRTVHGFDWEELTTDQLHEVVSQLFVLRGFRPLKKREPMRDIWKEMLDRL